MELFPDFQFTNINSNFKYMALKLLFDRNQMYIYPWYIADIAATGDIKKIAGNKVKKAFVVMQNDYLNMYYDIQSANKIGKYFFKKIVDDRRFFKKVINKIYKYSKDLINFCKDIDKTTYLKKLNNKKLLNIYTEYIKRLRRLRVWGWVPVFLDGMEKNFLTDRLQEKLNKYLIKIKQEDKLNDYYTLLSSSPKKSKIQTEELARLNLLAKIISHKKAKDIIRDIKNNRWKEFHNKYYDIYRLIDKHLKNFDWLTYAYSGPVMSIKYLFKQLSDNLKSGDIEQQKNTIINHYKDIKKQKLKLIKQLSLPNDLVYLFEVSSKLIFMKDYRKGIYQQSYVYMDNVLEEIAKRLEMSLKEIKYLVLSEVKDALINNEVDFYRKILKQRIKKCCYIVENSKIKVYQGNECENIIAKTIKVTKKAEQAKIKEFKGSVAYKGVVCGIVKIVLVEKDVVKVNKGDILVSSATNPNLISAMKKAAAFVTDTGGIISHATIVSRELKKPCLVGTKIATKILKDGDKIEVDANKGIVKIIKSTN